MSPITPESRISAKGDNFDTSSDRILLISTAKTFITIYIIWNAILAGLFLILSFLTSPSISVIFILPFLGTSLVFIFALKMRSKIVFAILAVYTMISLANAFFKMSMAFFDGDWVERSFTGHVSTFQSIITIFHSTVQFLITIVLFRISFWEMDASCCCCACCFPCCFFCPCFEEKREERWKIGEKSSFIE